MNTQEAKFDRLKEFLSALPAEFCLVYSAKRGLTGSKLKWCKAASLHDKITRADYDKLAAKYQDVALNSYEQKRNLILKENLPSANSKTKRWRGLDVRVSGDENPLPANSAGNRWWQLVIGSGAVHDAGYVIVARVAAKESEEAQGYVAKIQEVMCA